MKQITKKEMQKLIDNGCVKNTNKGFVNSHGELVGFYKTRNKRYIEDKYVDMANQMT